MKNSIKIIVLFMIIIMSIILVFGIRYAWIDRGIYIEQKLDESYEHLNQKYGKDLKVKLINYSTMDGFSANYSLADFPDIRFRVDYWKDKGQYYDDYLQQVLTNEIKQIINDKFYESGLSDINIKVGMMIGPPFDLTNRLYEHFCRLGRNPRIADIRHKEMFSYVTISSNDELEYDEKRMIQEILSSLNLPVEKIEVK